MKDRLADALDSLQQPKHCPLAKIELNSVASIRTAKLHQNDHVFMFSVTEFQEVITDFWKRDYLAVNGL